MNRVSIILMALMLLALVLFMAPNVFAMNRGKTLQTIALWLAIFLGLALVYKTFGPGSKMPLISAPAVMQRQNTAPPAQPPADGTNKASGKEF